MKAVRPPHIVGQVVFVDGLPDCGKTMMAHLLFVHTPLVLDALGDRGKIVEVVRHPLYMIKQQSLYMDRFASDPRDFSIWIEAEGGTVPWFARGWERKFLESNAMDRAIHMVDEMGRRHERMLAALTPVGQGQVLVIPFERFVIDPWPYMRQLETLLGTEVTGVTRREMKRQNVPRKMYAEGIGRPIYSEYGWQPPAKGSDEAREFATRRELAAGSATPEAMAILDRLSADYERKYMQTLTPEAQ